MIVGVTGPMGAGKSTVVQMMLERVPGARQLAFAEPLKKFCSEVYDWPLEKLEDFEFKATPDHRHVRLDRVECENLGFERHTDGYLRSVVELSEAELLDYKTSGEVHLTPRHAMQALGTEWGRECCKSTWVDLLLRRARDLEAAGCPLVVVSDCRFPEEKAAIEKLVGQVVKVTRPGGTVSTHASEHALDGVLFQWELANDGSLEALREKVNQLLVHLYNP